MYGNVRKLDNGMIHNLPDELSKVFILHGKGNKFCLPNSRLEIYVDKFFKGILKAKVLRDYYSLNSHTMTNGASLVRVFDVNTTMESLNAPFLGLQLLEGDELREALKEKKRQNTKTIKYSAKQSIKQKRKSKEEAGSSLDSSRVKDLSLGAFPKNSIRKLKKVNAVYWKTNISQLEYRLAVYRHHSMNLIQKKENSNQIQIV